MTPRSSPVRPRRRQPLSRRRPVRRLAAVVPLPSPSPHPSPRPQGGSPSKVGRYRSGVYFPASSWPRELNTLPHLRSRRPVEVAPAWRATSAMSAQRSRTSCTCGGQAPRRFAGDRRVGNPHRDLDRGVQVIGLDHVVPTEHLLGVGERPVGHQRIALLDPHCRRGVRWRELCSADHPRVGRDREVLRMAVRSR
jgi:hypothetical protein